MKYSSVKGMHDVLPPDVALWQWVEDTARRIFGSFGFAEIRTPIVEKTPLFVRSVGQHTALVEKEMYSFVDLGGEALTMRPEGTAPVVRAYLENDVPQKDPIAKFYYIGPMFRRERPQKGRYRQFHQLGVELLGASSPYADAEVLAMLMQFLCALGIADLRLEINSLGDEQCRSRYQDIMREFLQKIESQLCEDCVRRLDVNPMRVLDCKNPTCQQSLTDAPLIQDAWNDASREHFHQVCEGLERLGVEYWVNPRIVRGIDYYVMTAFEVVTHHLGAQSALCGGGRYNGLVRDLGGPDVDGVGFACGVERLVMELQERGIVPPAPERPRLFFALLGDAARDAVLPLLQQLRAQGCTVEWDYDNRSLKAQMKFADRHGFQQVVIVGEDEVAKQVVLMRDMETKEQTEISLEDLVKKFASGTK